jgi:predicted phage baseplate assembly protein
VPLVIPTIDDRSYQDLVNDALARIPVHNPEWTNFNESDPGVTLLEVFAFLADSLLYRANKIPERNRLKFLTLLGVPLQPGASAQGIATFANAQGPAQVFSLNGDLEVRAGQVPFRTEMGLDVLPIEAQVYYKAPLLNPDPTLLAYYNQLYQSYQTQSDSPQELALYQTTALTPSPLTAVNLAAGAGTVDGSLWIALLARSVDAANIAQIKSVIAGKTLTVGVLPGVAASGARLGVDTDVGAQTSAVDFYVPTGGALPAAPALRVATYTMLQAVPSVDVLTTPGVVEITLPNAAGLSLWTNLAPTEAGTGDFPPAIDDSTVSDRLITWIRFKPRAPAQAIIFWVGINAVPITQKTHVDGEVLPVGTGAPDQSAALAKTPLVSGSSSITVATLNSDGTYAAPEVWTRIDDLASAGPEVPVADPRCPPGTPPPPQVNVDVYVEDPEAGTITFGDGTRGARPPAGAQILASYDYSLGPAGNLGPGAISTAPSLPAGLTVTNPIATWGGAAAETASDGEKQITQYLQNRDRLVTQADFETITWRTPGVSIGRVEVLPAFHPVLSPNEPGDAPGVVTLMVLSSDPSTDADPVAQQQFLTAIANYLDPRRLVTTEIFLRGPDYVDVWVSIGVDVVSGASVHDTIVAVQSALQAFLSPLPRTEADPLPKDVPLTSSPMPDTLGADGGWPLRKSVIALEIQAVASRVPGVMLVNQTLLAGDDGVEVQQIDLVALELPRLAGLSIVQGDPAAITDLQGQTAAQAPTALPVPVVPEDCC